MPRPIPLRFSDALLPTGVRLAYAEQGDPTGPAVVLLHGYSDSWYSWSPILARLSPALHVFALSQRGHGDSERPAHGYRLDDFAEDALAFMDALGLATATIAGHSFGSWVAQRLASLAPERIDALLLVGTSATRRIAVVDELNAAAGALEDPVSVEFIREFQRSTIYRPVPEPFFERVVAESRKLPARVWREVAGAWLAEEWWADAARLRTPVRVLYGDRDTVMPREQQYELFAALPGAVLSVYHETGHALHWEQPGRFARELECFVEDACLARDARAA